MLYNLTVLVQEANVTWQKVKLFQQLQPSIQHCLKTCALSSIVLISRFPEREHYRVTRATDAVGSLPLSESDACSAVEKTLSEAIQLASRRGLQVLGRKDRAFLTAPHRALSAEPIYTKRGLKKKKHVASMIAHGSATQNVGYRSNEISFHITIPI